MRNIKLSFEHPSFIYPFRINLTPTSIGSDIDRINFKHTIQAIQRIHDQIILTTEQQKIFNSLSPTFKAQLVNQYSHRLQQRHTQDFLGDQPQQHYVYFENRCRGEITLKQMFELHHYILRTAKSLSTAFSAELWIKLSLLFYTNFSTTHFIKGKHNDLHWQLENFAALLILIEQTAQLVRYGVSAVELGMLLPLIQDTLVQSYLKLSNPQLQEQTLMSIAGWAKGVVECMKAKRGRHNNNPQSKDKVIQTQQQGNEKGKMLGGDHQKRDGSSVIYWIINFTPKNQESLTIGLNKHSILQLVMQFLPRSSNLLAVQSVIALIKYLFEQVGSFSQLLFLITEMVRYQFPSTLQTILRKIHQREFRSKQVFGYYLNFDIADLFGRETVQAFKLKEMIKLQKVNEKMFSEKLRELKKVVSQLTQDFTRYRKGKVTFRRTVRVGEVSRQEVEEREIMNIERLAEQSHHSSRSKDIIAMELYQENQELIKVNKWLEERVKKYQQTISTLINVNSKEGLRSKLRLQRQAIKEKVFPSKVAASYKPHLGSQNSGGNKKNDNKIEFLNEEGSSLEGSPKVEGEGYRKSYKFNAHNNLSIENILNQIPSIDVPQSRRKTINWQVQQSINNHQIFNEAKNMLTKTLQKQKDQKPTNSTFILPPPPPPPPLLPSGLGAPSFLPPPPPPPPLGLAFPPPPLSLLLPPPPPLLPLMPLSLGGGKVVKESKIEMKNIGWTILEPTKLKDTVWQGLDISSIKLDEQQVIKYFGRKQKEAVTVKLVTVQNKTLLKPDRAKNIEIILKKMKITQKKFEFIEKAFQVYDANYINQQFLVGLQNTLPTQKERIDFAEVKMEPDQNWTLADRFIAFTCGIEAFDDKISAILFKYEYQEAASGFFGKLQNFIRFYQDLYKDAFFHIFLQKLLVLGNFLNANTHRGNAKAFKIQNIDKSYLLIGQDNQTSLFDYTLKEISKTHPDLFDYPTLLDKTSSIVSLSILRDDYNYFQKKCEQVNQCILLSQQNQKDESAAFFLGFYMQTRDEVSHMKRKLEEATLLFKTVKQFYGDKLQSQEMARFIIDFRARVGQFRAKRSKPVR